MNNFFNITILILFCISIWILFSWYRLLFRNCLTNLLFLRFCGLSCVITWRFGSCKFVTSLICNFDEVDYVFAWLMLSNEVFIIFQVDTQFLGLICPSQFLIKAYLVTCLSSGEIYFLCVSKAWKSLGSGPLFDRASNIFHIYRSSFGHSTAFDNLIWGSCTINISL